MIPNEYVIAGVVLFSAGLIAISFWLIKSYKILIDKNEWLNDEITQRDEDAMQVDLLISDLQDRIDELKSYIHDYGSEWNSYAQTRADDEDSARTTILPSVQDTDDGRGRHSR